MKQTKTMKKAFSLIELGIVLIIIGIIIAAVMSGGDVIKNSETKQFYQNFARKWSTVIDSYYDRMGQQICDGEKHEGLDTELTPDGYFDGITLEGTKGSDVEDKIRSAGINLDRTVSTNQNLKSQFMIQGEFTGYEIVTIHLGAYMLDGIRYNFLILKDIPVDIAVAVDRYVDGVSNGAIGNAIAIQTDVSTITLPTNLSELQTTDLLLDYSEISTTTKTTNVGIIVEH
jgi:prepilin-type N-terminal cleavage/methylation domain-containing protein